MAHNRNQDFIIKFGQNLRRLRQERKISQEKLSHKTDLALSQIGRIERGEINTSLDQVKTIADALQIEPQKLFEFEQTQDVPQSNDKSHYSSKEVMKKLKIRSCDLMHMREAGKLNYVKNGNSYRYERDSVDRISG